MVRGASRSGRGKASVRIAACHAGALQMGGPGVRPLVGCGASPALAFPHRPANPTTTSNPTASACQRCTALWSWPLAPSRQCRPPGAGAPARRRSPLMATARIMGGASRLRPLIARRWHFSGFGRGDRKPYARRLSLAGFSHYFALKTRSGRICWDLRGW